MTKQAQVSLKEQLLAIGLTEHDNSPSDIGLNAHHTFDMLSPIFERCGWDLTFHGSVSKGLNQAAYSDRKFGGGNAILHYKQDSTEIHYVTISFSRNYYD